MKNFIKKHKFGIVAVILSMIMGVLYCLAKRVFHVDESLTFALTNAPGGWVSYDAFGWFEKDTWSVYTVADTFNYSRVFTNQTYDVHPPLYYCILHTIMSFFPYRFSLWFGFGVNLIFFLLDMVIIYYLIYKFTNKDIIGALAVLLFGFNYHILSGVNFLRMYMASSFFALLFLLFALRVLNKEGNKYVNLIGLLISTMCGGLTHYQFYMIMASICLCIGLCLLIEKRWFDLIGSALSVVLACVLNVFVIFKATLEKHLLVGHTYTAKESLKELGIPFDRLLYFMKNSWGGFLQISISIILLIVFIIFVVKKIGDKKKNINCLIIIGSYLIGFLIISKTSSFVTERYLIHLEAIGVIGNVLGLYTLLNEKLDIKILCLALAVMVTLNTNINYVNVNIKYKPSWDFASEHQDDIAYIVTDGNKVDYQVNTLFLDLRWYIATAISQTDKELTYPTTKNYVLYIDRNIDEKEALEYVKSQCEDKDVEFVIEKQENIKTSYFDVYTMTFK